ncbi:hypothetical protein Tco_0916022, partial [Tanacetum coccineum]
MADYPFDECYILVPRKMSPLEAKKPKNPPPKRTRNVGKSKHAQLTTSSSSDSPPSENGDLPSTKLSPRTYSRAVIIPPAASVGFAPQWIGWQNLNNNNGWLDEDDDEEPEKDEADEDDDEEPEEDEADEDNDEEPEEDEAD